ncbi:hypothetical protein ES705_07766 [subsurface metagenome]
MSYFKCEKCKAKFGGWGEGDNCDECGGKLKEISESEFDKIIKEKDKEESKK